MGVGVHVWVGVGVHILHVCLHAYVYVSLVDTIKQCVCRCVCMWW